MSLYKTKKKLNKKIRSNFKDTGIYCTSMQTVLWNGNLKCWFWFFFLFLFRLLLLFQNFETPGPVQQHICYMPVSSAGQLQDVVRAHHTDLVIIKLHPLICHKKPKQEEIKHIHRPANLNESFEYQGSFSLEWALHTVISPLTTISSSYST